MVINDNDVHDNNNFFYRVIEWESNPWVDIEPNMQDKVVNW